LVNTPIRTVIIYPLVSRTNIFDRNGEKWSKITALIGSYELVDKAPVLHPGDYYLQKVIRGQLTQIGRKVVMYVLLPLAQRPCLCCNCYVSGDLSISPLFIDSLGRDIPYEGC
jgi:hypothetical protein